MYSVRSPHTTILRDEYRLRPKDEELGRHSEQRQRWLYPEVVRVGTTKSSEFLAPVVELESHPSPVSSC